MPVKLPPVHTIGHSSRSIVEFAALLKVGSVSMVVDIRKTPRSRSNPQFDGDTLSEALSAWQIDYARIEELGGRRAKSRTVPPELNAFWTNQSFHNYADYTLSDTFRSGLSQLRPLSLERRAGGHVLGSCLVALPSAVRCRLPPPRGPGRLPFDGPGAG